MALWNPLKNIGTSPNTGSSIFDKAVSKATTDSKGVVVSGGYSGTRNYSVSRSSGGGSSSGGSRPVAYQVSGVVTPGMSPLEAVKAQASGKSVVSPVFEKTPAGMIARSNYAAEVAQILGNLKESSPQGVLNRILQKKSLDASRVVEAANTAVESFNKKNAELDTVAKNLQAEAAKVNVYDKKSVDSFNAKVADFTNKSKALQEEAVKVREKTVDAQVQVQSVKRTQQLSSVTGMVGADADRLATMRQLGVSATPKTVSVKNFENGKINPLVNQIQQTSSGFARNKIEAYDEASAVSFGMRKIGSPVTNPFIGGLDVVEASIVGKGGLVAPNSMGAWVVKQGVDFVKAPAEIGWTAGTLIKSDSARKSALVAAGMVATEFVGNPVYFTAGTIAGTGKEIVTRPGYFAGQTYSTALAFKPLTSLVGAAIKRTGLTTPRIVAGSELIVGKSKIVTGGTNLSNVTLKGSRLFKTQTPIGAKLQQMGFSYFGKSKVNIQTFKGVFNVVQEKSVSRGLTIQPIGSFDKYAFLGKERLMWGKVPKQFKGSPFTLDGKLAGSDLTGLLEKQASGRAALRGTQKFNLQGYFDVSGGGRRIVGDFVEATGTPKARLRIAPNKWFVEPGKELSTIETFKTGVVNLGEQKLKGKVSGLLIDSRTGFFNQDFGNYFVRGNITPGKVKDVFGFAKTNVVQKRGNILKSLYKSNDAFVQSKDSVLRLASPSGGAGARIESSARLAKVSFQKPVSKTLNDVYGLTVALKPVSTKSAWASGVAVSGFSEGISFAPNVKQVNQTSFKQFNANTQKNYERFNEKQIQNLKQVSYQKVKPVELQSLRVSQGSGSRVSQGQATVFKEAVRFQEKQAEQVRAVQRQQLKVASMSAFGFVPRAYVPVVPKVPVQRKRVDDYSSQRAKDYYKAFVAVARVRGRDVVVSRALPRGRAFSVGAGFVGRTTAKSFRLKEAGFTSEKDVAPKNVFAFRKKKGKSRLKGDFFIEKDAFAIDTLGEKLGLKKAKKNKARKRGWFYL